MSTNISEKVYKHCFSFEPLSVFVCNLVPVLMQVVMYQFNNMEIPCPSSQNIKFYNMQLTIRWWHNHFPDNFLAKFIFRIGYSKIFLSIIRGLCLSFYILVEVQRSQNVSIKKQKGFHFFFWRKFKIKKSNKTFEKCLPQNLTIAKERNCYLPFEIFSCV